ncbi:MAG TPA: helix-turn-helix domain-containing protein [Chloroflexota bacterium]|nr:helix-turn-helix domain-containing protein [Chloroflexota bacterium]
MRTYGGFCPVAKAAEIFAERWTPLIIRELLAGSHRFHELEQGVPGIPHSLLVQRLRSLERAGVVERRTTANGRRVEYWPTPAGQGLWDVVRLLGEWGQRWVNHDIGPADTDPQLLMWDMHRRIHLDRLPERRVVVQFEFRGARQGVFWLVLERPEPSVCLKDPEFDVDMRVTADTVALHRVWMGQMALADAMHRGLVEIDGPRELVWAFPDWLALNLFASVPPAATRLSPA